MRLETAAKALLLKEFVGAIGLSMRYFFKPKATLNYPHEKNPTSPRAPEVSRDQFPNQMDILPAMQAQETALIGCDCAGRGRCRRAGGRADRDEVRRGLIDC